VVTLIALYVQGRLHEGQVAVVGPDLILGILFIAAFLRTPAGSNVPPPQPRIHEKDTEHSDAGKRKTIF
jgi:hypothetical protein